MIDVAKQVAYWRDGAQEDWVAQLACLELSSEHADILAEMNTFVLEARYPETLLPPPNEDEARRYMARAEEVLLCLIPQS
ncbi:MAG: HEPN domain-containing protein [Planctomycetes bacterium]|nr:HEPN domain-containing protein [Planctomycetota bacterium]